MAQYDEPVAARFLRQTDPQRVVAYLVMANIVMAYIVMAYLVMANTVMTHLVMANVFAACVVMAHSLRYTNLQTRLTGKE